MPDEDKAPIATSETTHEQPAPIGAPSSVENPETQTAQVPVNEPLPSEPEPIPVQTPATPPASAPLDSATDTPIIPPDDTTTTATATNDNSPAPTTTDTDAGAQ